MNPCNFRMTGKEQDEMHTAVRNVTLRRSSTRKRAALIGMIVATAVAICLIGSSLLAREASPGPERVKTIHQKKILNLLKDLHWDDKK